jgi:hypothetical protein
VHRLPAGGLLGHCARQVRRLKHIGIEAARSLDRGKMRVHEFGGGEFALAQPVASFAQRQRRKIRHSSPGLSHAKGLAGLALRFVRLGTGNPAASKSAGSNPGGIAPRKTAISSS